VVSPRLCIELLRAKVPHQTGGYWWWHPEKDLVKYANYASDVNDLLRDGDIGCHLAEGGWKLIEAYTMGDIEHYLEDYTMAKEGNAYKIVSGKEQVVNFRPADAMAIIALRYINYRKNAFYDKAKHN